MVTEETLKTHEMELESRIRNLVWTVSGDYTLKLKPDVERYAKEYFRHSNSTLMQLVRHNPPGRLFVLL